LPVLSKKPMPAVSNGDSGFWPAPFGFERMEFKVDDSFDSIDGGALIAEAMREDDENDPFLESYQIYRGTDDSISA
jgi:hypothetical protein